MVVVTCGSCMARWAGHSWVERFRTIIPLTSWTLTLNDNLQLCIEGQCDVDFTLIACFPVSNRVSSYWVTSNQTLLKLNGSFISDKVPEYVAKKFCSGFPVDWKNVAKKWVEHNQQDDKSSFSWDENSIDVSDLSKLSMEKEDNSADNDAFCTKEVQSSINSAEYAWFFSNSGNLSEEGDETPKMKESEVQRNPGNEVERSSSRNASSLSDRGCINQPSHQGSMVVEFSNEDSKRISLDLDCNDSSPASSVWKEIERTGESKNPEDTDIDYSISRGGCSSLTHHQGTASERTLPLSKIQSISEWICNVNKESACMTNIETVMRNENSSCSDEEIHEPSIQKVVHESPNAVNSVNVNFRKSVEVDSNCSNKPSSSHWNHTINNEPPVQCIKTKDVISPEKDDSLRFQTGLHSNKMSNGGIKYSESQNEKTFKPTLSSKHPQRRLWKLEKWRPLLGADGVLKVKGYIFVNGKIREMQVLTTNNVIKWGDKEIETSDGKIYELVGKPHRSFSKVQRALKEKYRGPIKCEDVIECLQKFQKSKVDDSFSVCDEDSSFDILDLSALSMETEAVPAEGDETPKTKESEVQRNPENEVERSSSRNVSSLSDRGCINQPSHRGSMVVELSSEDSKRISLDLDCNDSSPASSVWKEIERTGGSKNPEDTDIDYSISRGGCSSLTHHQGTASERPLPLSKIQSILEWICNVNKERACMTDIETVMRNENSSCSESEEIHEPAIQKVMHEKPNAVNVVNVNCHKSVEVDSNCSSKSSSSHWNPKEYKEPKVQCKKNENVKDSSENKNSYGDEMGLHSQVKLNSSVQRSESQSDKTFKTPLPSKRPQRKRWKLEKWRPVLEADGTLKIEGYICANGKIREIKILSTDNVIKWDGKEIETCDGKIYELAEESNENEVEKCAQTPPTSPPIKMTHFGRISRTSIKYSEVEKWTPAPPASMPVKVTQSGRISRTPVCDSEVAKCAQTPPASTPVKMTSSGRISRAPIKYNGVGEYSQTPSVTMSVKVTRSRQISGTSICDSEVKKGAQTPPASMPVKVTRSGRISRTPNCASEVRECTQTPSVSMSVNETRSRRISGTSICDSEVKKGAQTPPASMPVKVTRSGRISRTPNCANEVGECTQTPSVTTRVSVTRSQRISGTSICDSEVKKGAQTPPASMPVKVTRSGRISRTPNCASEVEMCAKTPGTPPVKMTQFGRVSRKPIRHDPSQREAENGYFNSNSDYSSDSSHQSSVLDKTGSLLNSNAEKVNAEAISSRIFNPSKRNNKTCVIEKSDRFSRIRTKLRIHGESNDSSSSNSDSVFSPPGQKIATNLVGTRRKTRQNVSNFIGDWVIESRPETIICSSANSVSGKEDSQISFSTKNKSKNERNINRKYSSRTVQISSLQESKVLFQKEKKCDSKSERKNSCPITKELSSSSNALVQTSQMSKNFQLQYAWRNNTVDSINSNSKANISISEYKKLYLGSVSGSVRSKRSRSASITGSEMRKRVRK